MCVKVELYTIDYIIHSHNDALIIMILSTRFLCAFLRNLLSNNTKHIKKQSTLSRGCFFIALYTIILIDTHQLVYKTFFYIY